MAPSGESQRGPAPEGPPGAPAPPSQADPGSAPPPAGAAEFAWVPSPAQRRIEPLLAALAPEPEPGFLARLARWVARLARGAAHRGP